jgi:hypothetical protein
MHTRQVHIPESYGPPETESKVQIRVRLGNQLMSAIKTGFVTCIGPHPESCDWRAHENHVLKLPLWKAYRCLYCGFYFCEKCAGEHFGKTRQEYEKEKSTR